MHNRESYDVATRLSNSDGYFAWGIFSRILGGQANKNDISELTEINDEDIAGIKLHENHRLTLILFFGFGITTPRKSRPVISIGFSNPSNAVTLALHLQVRRLPAVSFRGVFIDQMKRNRIDGMPL